MFSLFLPSLRNVVQKHKAKIGKQEQCNIIYQHERRIEHNTIFLPRKGNISQIFVQIFCALSIKNVHCTFVLCIFISVLVVTAGSSSSSLNH